MFQSNKPDRLLKNLFKRINATEKLPDTVFKFERLSHMYWQASDIMREVYMRQVEKGQFVPCDYDPEKVSKYYQQKANDYFDQANEIRGVSS